MNRIKLVIGGRLKCECPLGASYFTLLGQRRSFWWAGMQSTRQSSLGKHQREGDSKGHSAEQEWIWCVRRETGSAAEQNPQTREVLNDICNLGPLCAIIKKRLSLVTDHPSTFFDFVNNVFWKIFFPSFHSQNIYPSGLPSSFTETSNPNYSRGSCSLPNLEVLFSGTLDNTLWTFVTVSYLLAFYLI